jgi:nicotinamide mononucleotide adenylyltransferase
MNQDRSVIVYLGRFAPFHKGHQMVVKKIVEEFGVQNCLIMIGSSNSYNERTPYTFEMSKEMIESVYPEINIIPLPDMKPALIYFDSTTNDEWLEQLKKIEEEYRAKFTFVGGSPEDLEVLTLGFPTKLIVDRKARDNSLSATQVREALERNDLPGLAMTLDEKVVPLAISGYTKFKKGI